MKSKRLIVISVLVIMGIIILAVFRLNDDPLSGAPDNVFLISIDTIRADHMSCYGYEHKTTPNIDAFAKKAILFEYCFANIPLTLPSHATMLTGLIPPTHGVHDNFNMALSDSVITLPEMLQKKGYNTYGIISAEVLNHQYGLNQGFDVYDDIFEAESGKDKLTAQRTADETAKHALTWLNENQDKKKFMFLHFYDPHEDYVPPAPYNSQFQHPYDGEIAFTDHCIGEFLNKLKSLDLYEESLIIITGDHAELLDEHGVTGHGFFVYQNALRVPLIIKPPFHTKPVKIKGNVTLPDIAPTIMAQCEIGIPDYIQGINLGDYFNGEDEITPERLIFNECLTATIYNGNSLLGVIQNQWHYIQTTRPELYNWLKDPVELNNLYIREPQRSRILQQHLSEILEGAVSTGEGSSISLDSKSVQALESLGYVGGSIDTDFSFNQSKPDPKDIYNIHIDMKLVADHRHNKKYDQAIKICKRHLARDPDILPFYDELGKIYSETQEYDKVIDLGKTQLSRTPTDIRVMKILVKTYNLAEKYEQAVEQINDILKIDPDDFDSFFFLGVAFFNKNEPEEAKKNFERALQINPDFVDAKLWLATIYQKQKQYTEALKYFKEALILKPDSVSIFDNIASIYLEQGKLNQAVDYWRKALELKPANIKFLNTLAWIHAACDIEELRNPPGAVDLAERACKLTEYKDPEILDTMSAAYGAAGAFDKAVETARKAIELARSKNKNDFADRIQTKLDLYRQGKAYLDPNLKSKNP